MKNIFKVVTTAALALTMTACEDFLTKTPETSLAPESFFSSEKELELWTNNEYSTLLDDATAYAEISAWIGALTVNGFALRKYLAPLVANDENSEENDNLFLAKLRGKLHGTF